LCFLLFNGKLSDQQPEYSHADEGAYDLPDLYDSTCYFAAIQTFFISGLPVLYFSLNHFSSLADPTGAF
jgi:hypothetical protein